VVVRGAVFAEGEAGDEEVGSPGGEEAGAVGAVL
jgi:hypothetical protein